MKSRQFLVATMAGVLATVTVHAPRSASADGRIAMPANTTWKTECGACHLAYPPALLPARSWLSIVATLDKHFGTDASVDPKAAAEIASFLERNAGRDRGVTRTNRITDTAWFVRKHREVPLAAWKHADVRSPANCGACHRAAASGDYDEHGVRIPR